MVYRIGSNAHRRDEQAEIEAVGRARARSGSSTGSGDGLDVDGACPGCATRWGIPARYHSRLRVAAGKCLPYSWIDHCTRRCAAGHFCGCPCESRLLGWFVLALIVAAMMWASVAVRVAVVCGVGQGRWSPDAWYDCVHAAAPTQSELGGETVWFIVHAGLGAAAALLLLPLPRPIAARLDLLCSGHRGRWHVLKHALLALPLCIGPLLAIVRRSVVGDRAQLGADLFGGAFAFSVVLLASLLVLLAVDAAVPAAFGTPAKLSEHDSERWSFKLVAACTLPLHVALAVCAGAL